MGEMTMKAPVMALTIAVAVFAGSSLYLWQQLQAERELSAQIRATSRQLDTRIAALEKSREHFIPSGGTHNGAVISGVLRAGAAPPVVVSPGAAGSAMSGVGWTQESPRERPPAMDKMMRWQIRADHKRMYGDVGKELGLSKEKTGHLIDLLTEQQMAQFNSFTELPGPAERQEAQRRLEEAQRANDAAIQDLLGPEKALALQEYQQSLPARQEFELLVNQLEGNDVTLTPEQNSRLLKTYLEERKRVPMPMFDQRTDPAAYHQAYSAWQEDYSSRVADEARHILDSTQLNAFDEVQQWQQEMRTQFRAVTFSTSGPVSTGIALRADAVGFSAPVTVTAGAPAARTASPEDSRQRRD
jgi:hypothetical protein